jgi:hypothetical protein
MNLNRERKVYVAIFGLAAGALVVDRVMLDSGVSDPASAGAETLLVASGGSVPSIDGLSAMPDKAKATLASHLGKLADPSDINLSRVTDAFKASSAWNPEPVKQPAQVEKKTPDGTHTLTAILTGKNAAAVIDGKPISVGGQVDGYTLVSVGEDKAVLESAKSRLVLHLPGVGQ